MASESDSSDDVGCIHYGIGCLGGFFVVNVLLFAVAIPFGASFSILGVFVCGVLLVIPGAILGLAASKYPWATETRQRMGVAGKYMLGFAAISLVTAIGLTLRPADLEVEKELAAEGGMVGPIQVEEAGRNAYVEVYQNIHEGAGSRFERWSHVTVELLDEKKQYLSSFGGGFWHEAGYDGGSHWQEDDDEFETKLAFPSAGTYYLQLKTEANVDFSELSPVSLELTGTAWWGNPLPFQVAGYVTLFLGLIMALIPAGGAGSSKDWDVEIDVDDGVEFEEGGFEDEEDW